MQAHRKRQRRQDIIQAAVRVFARKGFAGSLIADIALAAGIGKGTVYEYFDSKEDLFFAAFEWYALSLARSATVPIAKLAQHPASQLEALSDAVMQTWTDIKDMFALIMEFWAASASSAMRDRFKAAFKHMYEHYRQIVAAVIRNGVRQGDFRRDVDAEAIAAALVGTWDALFLQAWFDDDFDPLTVSRHFMQIVISGLDPASASAGG